jgi:hypothetical protein
LGVTPMRVRERDNRATTNRIHRVVIRRP